LRFCDVHKGGGRIDIDASREFRIPIDRGRNDRGKVDDRLWSHFGDKPLGLVAIRQVGPSRLGAAGQLRDGFAVGGGVEVGGDHMAA